MPLLSHNIMAYGSARARGLPDPCMICMGCMGCRWAAMVHNWGPVSTEEALGEAHDRHRRLLKDWAQGGGLDQNRMTQWVTWIMHYEPPLLPQLAHATWTAALPLTQACPPQTLQPAISRYLPCLPTFLPSRCCPFCPFWELQLQLLTDLHLSKKQMSID
jgi:hypothetical protein